jgi:GNAT superfamily N-acetyltransferase
MSASTPAVARPDTVRVRRLAPGDLDWTSRLHAAELGHGFFARLGLPLLRTYHGTFADSPFGIALVAEDEDGPAGFLVGAAEAQPHRAWVLRNRRLRLTAHTLLGLGRHPRAALDFVRTRVPRYGRALLAYRGDVRYRDLRSSQPTAVLKHVVVDGSRRRAGAGRALAEAFAEEASRRGAVRARLTTLAGGDAEPFWQALEWRPTGADLDEDGHLHRVYVLDLSR